MSAPSRPTRPPRWLGFGSILLANLLPLAGVFWFGWDGSTLVVIYGLELLCTFLLAGLKALFAQRPPRTDHDESGVISVSHELIETRGSVELVSWLPPIYPRNLPFATAVVNSAFWFLFMAGAALSSVFTVGDVLARPEVLVSALALVVAQSVDTWGEYLREGYKTASPYSVIETPGRQAFFLAFVLMVTPGIGVVGVEGLLAVIVGVKLLAEWSAYRGTTDGTGRLTEWLAGPTPNRTDADPIAVSNGTPEARISTDGRAVLYTGAFDVLGTHAPFAVLPFAFGLLFAMTFLGDGAPTAVVVAISLGFAVSFVGYLALRVLMSYLQYGSLEYRRYGDQIVAYNTLLAEPQWSTSISTLRSVEVVPDRLADRLLGTRTVAVTTSWGDSETRRYLGPTADPDGLVSAFELPLHTTDIGPLDRRPATVVIAILAGLVGGVIVLLVGPWMAFGEVVFSGLLYGAFGAPFLAVVLQSVWVQSYPDRTAEPVGHSD